jgi:hypothetical protein
MSYFHFTMARLAPGSVIEPGNWGRLLRKYQNAPATNGAQFGAVWVLTRELVFELERTRNFPTRPSRFCATFCFTDRANAEVYRSLNDQPHAQVLHEVEHVTPAAPSHVGYVSKCNWPGGGQPFLDVMTNQANDYWRGDGDGVSEIVSTSGLRVVSCLD